MPIIGALPFDILDGQLIDAPPVMADFQWIVDQVNANVPALIPSTTGALVNVTAVGGTANAITLNPAPALGSYSALNRFQFIATGTNTGSTTVNVSGLGAKSILWPDGTAMSGGELIAGDPVDVCYNGTFFVLMMNPGPLGIQTTTCGILFGGAAVGVTYSLNTLVYFKIGRQLYFNLDMVLSNKGSSTGFVQVTGLPYPISASWAIGTNATIGSIWTQRVNFANGFLAALPASGLSTLGIINSPSGGGSAFLLSDTNFSNTSEVVISGSYIV